MNVGVREMDKVESTHVWVPTLGNWVNGILLTELSNTRQCGERFLLETVGEQEGDSDVGCVNFKILEGYSSRDVQKVLGIQS